MEIKVRAGKGEYFKDVNEIIITSEKGSYSLKEMLERQNKLEEENKKLKEFIKKMTENQKRVDNLLTKSVDLLSLKMSQVEDTLKDLNK